MARSAALRHGEPMLLPVALAALTLPLGHPQRVGRLLVTPIKVIEDSRCPMNARCIWAGRVIVRVSVRDGPRRTARDLTLGEPTAGLVLDTVEPGRLAGPPTPPGAYRFHFAGAPLSR